MVPLGALRQNSHFLCGATRIFFFFSVASSQKFLLIRTLEIHGGIVFQYDFLTIKSCIRINPVTNINIFS